VEKLKVLLDAMADGLQRGALIHEKTGSTHPVEVIAAEQDRLIALVRCRDGALELLQPDAKVRVELPQDASVVFVPGRVREMRAADGGAELEIACEAAESRQRRMDVRIDADCRIRLGGNGDWEETRTVNISAGGLLVSESHARIGEIVDIEMELEGSVFKCRAEVVRRGVKTHGAASRTSAALKFIGLPEPNRERIALFVLRSQACQKLGRNR
jgi:c-di-GMP-binding flagellar brake protein YcgR